MAIKAIEAVKEAECKADTIIQDAKSKADLLLEKANIAALGIIDSKKKEALKKADLRINFAKNERDVYKRKTEQETTMEISNMRQNVKGREDLIKKIILDEIFG